MAGVWRFTGSPENWITAITRQKWALNENNKALWEKRIIEEGDPIMFHSTANSEYTKKAPASIIGFGFAGPPQPAKTDHWWVEEVREKKNKWPYVVALNELYVFSDISGIDVSRSVDLKTDDVIVKEIGMLTKNSLTLAELNKQAQELSPGVKSFPVNGSASHVNQIYEDLILRDRTEYFSPKSENEDRLEQRVAESVDSRFEKMSKEELLADATKFKSQGVSHAIRFGAKKVRKENQVQKRRVAALENFTCQVCSFKAEYVRSNGKTGYIIHVDHIKEKSEGGDESLKNLWALCPNCHAKKTYGVIQIDVTNEKVYENEKEIDIEDNHLFSENEQHTS